MSSTTQSNRTKRGEIFQLPNNQFSLVCIHCFKEFYHFTEFTLHVQMHFHGLVKIPSTEFQSCSVDIVRLKTDSPSTSIQEPLIAPNNIKDLVESDDDLECSNHLESEYRDESSASEMENTKEALVNRKSFECFICHKSLSKAYVVKRHMKIHQYADLHCKICNVSFRTSRYYDRHMATLHPNRTKFVSQLPITEPIEQAKIYACKLCNKNFRDRRQLQNHMTSHKQCPSLCLVCGKLFSGERTLSRHMELHNPDETHSCTECGRKFKQRRYLLEHHRKVHNLYADNGQAICDICNQQFENKRALQIHKHSSHPFVVKRNFPCSICHFAAKCAYDLRRHIETHSNENRSFECEICHKKLLPRYANDHMKSHESTRNFECKECGQRFKRASALKRHQKLHETNHEDGSTFECDVCSKKFIRMDGLLRHRRRHGVAMNYHCRVCNKGFIEQKSYLFHEASHTKGNVKTEQIESSQN